MRYSILRATVEQVKNVGGTAIKEAPRAGVVFAELTEQQAAQLRVKGCQVNLVEKVEPVVTPPVAPPVPVAGAPVYSPEQLVYAAGLEELRSLTSPPLNGEGYNIAIIDTGIRETHEKINGRVIYRKNFTTDPMRDGLDHGTGVASIVLAVAPSCNILNMKVLDDTGSGTEEEVILAIDECIDLWDTQPNIAPSVINLSLGAPDDGNQNNTLRVVCRAAIEKGIWIAAAAGNSGPSQQTIMNPACEKYVFAVGSAGYDPYTVSGFSSRGPTRGGLIKPDLVFFGENINMASSSDDTAAVAKSGTSFSAPFASGVCILYQEISSKWLDIKFPEGPPEGYYLGTVKLFPVNEVMDEHLINVCYKPQGAPSGKDYDYGYGVPLGQLVMSVVRSQVGMDITGLLSAVMAVGMMGMFIKVLK